jgi:hypothetical protein
MWYRQPATLTADWERQVIATQSSTNGMDLADMDGDGDIDVITGELLGQQRLTVWENVLDAGVVGWTAHPVAAGKESHLGARVWDLDGDGDLELVNIGFNQPRNLDIWVNR